MAGWSFKIGRVFGVEVRVHSFFLFLLIPSVLWAGVLSRTPARGVALWMLLVVAVLVREVARAIAAACLALDGESLLLLPTGGLMTYAGAEAETRAGSKRAERTMALVGPLANIGFGLMMAGLIRAVSPEVRLTEAPWITPLHLLRTLVWVNLLLAALNLVPAWPLDGGRVARGELTRGASSPQTRRQLQVVARMAFWFALAMLSWGLTSFNWWWVMAGLGVMLAGQVERQGLLQEPQSEGTRVGDVMLTDYAVISASATLEDAMMQARHCLQDVFPVVRAGNMVGAVGRQSIVNALATNGNGYVQGIMTKSFQTARAEDLLLETLNKAVGPASAGAAGGMRGQSGTLEIVPVLRGDAIVGILTPAHLHRTLRLLERRPMRSARAAEDGTE